MNRDFFTKVTESNGPWPAVTIPNRYILLAITQDHPNTCLVWPYTLIYYTFLILYLRKMNWGISPIQRAWASVRRSKNQNIMFQTKRRDMSTSESCPELKNIRFYYGSRSHLWDRFIFLWDGAFIGDFLCAKTTILLIEGNMLSQSFCLLSCRKIRTTEWA